MTRTVILLLASFIVITAFSPACLHAWDEPEHVATAGASFSGLPGHGVMFGYELSYIHWASGEHLATWGAYLDGQYGSSKAFKSSLGPEIILHRQGRNFMMAGMDGGVMLYHERDRTMVGGCIRPFLVIACVIIPYARFNFNGDGLMSEYGIMLKVPLCMSPWPW